MRFDGAHFSVDGVSVTGDSPAFPSVKAASTRPVVTGHVYAAGAPDGALIDLHPLVTAKEGREPGATQVCLFDGIRGARPNEANLKGTEPLRYSDLWTAEREVDIEPQLTSVDLRGITPDW
jgi:hypothetical protein